MGLDITDEENIKIDSELTDSGMILGHLKWSEPKHYAREHMTEFIFAICFFVICAAAGTYFSFFALSNLLEKKTEVNIFISIILVLIICLIYYAEYHNISQIARKIRVSKTNKKKWRIGALRWVIAGVLSAINISLVLIGTYFQTIETDTSVNSLQNSFSSDSLKIITDFNMQISEYNKKIEDVKVQFSWKNKIGAGGQALISNYDIKIINLRAEKTKALENHNLTKKEAVTVAKSELNNFIWLKLVFALLIETIVFGCSYAIGNYRAGVWAFEKKKLLRKERLKELKKDSGNSIRNSNSDKKEPEKKEITGEKNGATYSEPVPDNEKKKLQRELE